jgi:probable F420-dependent oxidoreductase
MTETKTSDPGGPGGSSAIGSSGVWIRTDAMTARETAELARRVEALGYGTFWFPEIQGRHAFVQAGWLLAATERLHVATGIANIFLREPYATATAQRTLAEQSDGRFVLGLGISHATFVQRVLDRQYQSPVTALETYLDRMESIVYAAPEPKSPAPTVLAALGPRAPPPGRPAHRRLALVPGTARAHRAGPRDPRARALALRRAESPP